MSSRLARILSPRSPYPYLAAATIGLGWWTSIVLGSTNSQKAHSGIFKAVLYHVRHDAAAQALLGNDITYDPQRHPAVKGTVNMMKGNADIEFVAEGDHGAAVVRFRGRRGVDDWDSEVFTLTESKGGKVVDLH
ncbi:hypothetical protein HDU87_008827 [Geranomyces variabilis]|uniref:Uncharacterized protein n=1 Tax=Geranomyces variabilis TaxID=109894 RepID=A0AAD5TCD2_9FUNG|nr:hypothetical protein HDU87_008827 [Geranomyces variabilis]